MAKQTETQAVARKKKLTAKKINLAKADEGFSLAGKYVGMTQGAPFNDVDQKTGEIIQKTLTFATFENTEGERLNVIADKGLQSALTEAMVKEGDRIELVKLAKTQLSKGRSMNQYDIYSIQ